MALTSWNDILNKPKAVADVEELALTVEQLSASVLSINEDLGEIALDVSQLSASVLSIAGDVEELSNKIIFFDYEATIETTDTGVVKEFSVTNLPENYKLVSVEPVYSTDYFHYCTNKGIFGVSVKDTKFTIRIETGNVGDNEERKINFRIIATKTN